MPRVNAPRKHEQKAIINISFFILLSLPLVVFGLLQDSFDTRNRAFDDLELSDENPCIISLPHVNPYTLEVGKTVTIQVDAKLDGSGIAGLEITDSSGNSIHQETYENYPLEIGTSFSYTPTKSGTVDLLGLIKKGEGGSVACKISSPYDIKGLRAISNNLSPEFTSKASSSKPSQDIKTGTIYEYTLTAEDKDGDRINYFYSFTPRADWLKPTIVEDGSNGKLTIRFKGTSEKASSYLANIFIHDGYSTHLRSQSWVISVSPAENDIPVIKIIDPLESLRLNAGDSFKTSWEASDLNHISKYQLFMAKNPTDESSWITVDNNIAYDKTSYTVPTSSLSSGTYKVIAKAVDNRTPAGIGTAISSEEIVISRTTDTEDENDDSVVMATAQVTNMSPSSTDEITNRRITIKATAIASDQAKIEEESISFKVDGIDVSENVKINRISESEFTLIYQPQEDLSTGLHKAEIYFKDTNEKEITKGWDFTVTGEEKDDSEYINVFGYDIAKRTLIIIGIGILIVAIALVAPFVIASIWKDDKKKTGDDVYSNSKLPPSIPSEENTYIEPMEVPEIKEMVENTPVEETPVEDVWNSFSAPTPVVEEVVPESVPEVVTEAPPAPAVVTEIPPTPLVQEVAPAEQPMPPVQVEPVIPEPEIPSFEQLQNINDQIVQQTQDQDTNSTVR